MNPERQILKPVETEDGSHTLYVPSLDENYHSTHGAIQESRHVFIEAGFKATTETELTIFEVGFGTGLNALLTLNEARKTGKKINYISIEKYPLNDSVWSTLNYTEQLNYETKEDYELLHKAQWGSSQQITDNFSLLKIEADLKSFNFDQLPKTNLIYFDAFAPGKQPRLWTSQIFENIAHRTVEKGILVTYCAKGEVRRNLQSAGFIMERLPGPPGKREMLRGRKESI